MKKRTMTVVLAGILAAALGLSAGAADNAGIADGVLDVGYGAAIDTLTPFRSNVANDAPYMINLYESLGLTNSDGELELWVAKSWTTEDYFTYDIEIYDYVTDSAGNNITADDIVWFIEEAKTRGLKPCFTKVESVEKTGDYTIRLKMNTNMIGSFDAVMLATFAVSKDAFLASENEFATQAVTTSAYEVTEFVASATLKFERRDDYWQDIELLPKAVRPQVQSCKYHIITEASQMGIALETNVIDVAIQMDNSTAIQFIDNPDFHVEITDGTKGWTLFFSGSEERPAGRDEKLCQAICYAIDTEAMVVGLCNSAEYGDVMADPCGQGLIGFDPEWKNEDYYSYNPEKAKEILAESDYNGETLSILCSSATFNQRMAQMIQAYCGAVGINVELNSLDIAGVMAIRLDGSQYDMFINTIQGPFLADHWSIRYDPAAYSTGDGTSRHDYELAELLYKTWTVEGYTKENIDEVHDYLRDHAIAYGLINPKIFTVWNNECGLEEEVIETLGYIAPTASKWTIF